MFDTLGDKISKLDNNINLIKKSFNFSISPDINSSEIIRKKIEENYMLLNELEKTNKPIFSKTTESKNAIYVEDKINEMNNKLGTIFKSDNAKRYKEENIYYNTIRFTENIQKSHNNTKDNNIKSRKISTEIKEKTTNTNDIINIREKKIKELYSRLDMVEERIKEIAGNILKNF